MNSGIYIIFSNQKPDKLYIGSAVNLRERWKRHRRELRRKKHFNAKLTNHVNLYGVDDLLFQVIEYCPKEELIQKEQFWIDFFNPSFNINPTAGSRFGSKQSIKTKLLISKKSARALKENISSRYARLMKIN